MNPLDFILWGHIKNAVYKNRPQNIEDLQQRIRYEISNIPPDALSNSLQNFCRRINFCQEVNGAHFENFIK